MKESFERATPRENTPDPLRELESVFAELSERQRKGEPMTAEEIAELEAGRQEFFEKNPIINGTPGK